MPPLPASSEETEKITLEEVKLSIEKLNINYNATSDDSITEEMLTAASDDTLKHLLELYN